MSSKSSILLTGGTGKVSRRIIPLLSSNGNTILVASRSGKCPSLPNAAGVKFDWFDSTTYASSFSKSEINAIFLVAPPIIDCFPPMKALMDLAVEKGVQRFVLLSGSVLDVGDGPMMGKVSKHISSLGVEWAILRPTWFMGMLLSGSSLLLKHANGGIENFSEEEHMLSIRDEDRIITGTGEGKVPFVSADDIAAVAFHALTDEVPHNADHLILGPELWSYDEVSSS
jgi:festuclavine dehydrogenase